MRDGLSRRIELSDDLWDRVALADPSATFFHTRAWSEALAASYPYLYVAARAFELADGAAAVLPLIERRWLGGILHSYESVTPGVYGGPIAERPLSNDEVAAMLDSLRSPRVAKLAVQGNPYAGWRLPPRAANESEFTQAVNLAPGFDAVFGATSHANRKNVRKAEASGVSISIASSDTEYAAFYALYLEAVRRWGRNAMISLPLQLFTNIRDRGGDAVRLWLTHHDGQVIGGALDLYHNRHVVCWYSAYLESGLDYRPANLVHHNAMRDACERGFAWYDFNPSGGQVGTVRFKDSFAPVRLDYQRISTTAGVPIFAATKIRRRLKLALGRREL